MMQALRAVPLTKNIVSIAKKMKASMASIRAESMVSSGDVVIVEIWQ